MSDLWHALRRLRRNPWFTIPAVVTIALGVAAPTAIFTVVNAVVLRPLVWPQPGRLVRLFEAATSTDRAVQHVVNLGVRRRLAVPEDRLPVSAPVFAAWQGRRRTLEQVAAVRSAALTLTGHPEPVHVPGASVSVNFFETLGVRLLAGRGFDEVEDHPGSDHVVVVSERLWRDRFGGDGRLLGRELHVDGRPRTVIGIVPAGQEFPLGAQLWVPLALSPPMLDQGERRAHYLDVVARLRADATLEQAQHEVDEVLRTLPWQTAGEVETRAFVVSLQESLVGDVRFLLFVLFGAAGCVLVVACVNAAQLFLTWSLDRRRELAIRAALGAGSGTVARQLVVESLLVAVAGGAMGLAASIWLRTRLVGLAPADVPRLEEVGVDGIVLAFAVAASLATGVVCALAPVLLARRRNLIEVLRDDVSGPTARQRRVGALLVVAEVAISVALLTTACVLSTSLVRLLAVDPGFRAADVLAFEVALPTLKYRDAHRRVGFFQDVLHRLSTLPGAAVAATFSGTDMSYGFAIEGPAEGLPQTVGVRAVSAEYFRVLGVPVRRGRTFDARDTETAPRVALVNEVAEARLWPGRDPVGQRIRLRRDRGEVWREVVGVVGSVLAVTAAAASALPAGRAASLDPSLTLRRP